jgi:hypothetical protein
MDQPYSVWADLLNKFHTSSEPIQMLWLLVVLLMVVGVTWCLTRLLRDIAVAAMRPRRESRNVLVYGVVQDAGGQWQVIRHGHAPKPLDWTNPPPELLGRVAELD